MDAKGRPEGWLHRTFGDGGPAFLGAIIGGVLTGAVAISVAAIQEVGETSRLEAQLAEENHDELAELRRDAYRTYLNAAEKYKFLAIDRVTTCKPGTDAPLRKEQPCAVALMGAYQSARYDVQGAVNEIHRVGSEDAETAMEIMIGSLPPTLGTGHSVPVESMPDDDTFTYGYNALLDAMECETVPVVPESCPPDPG